MDAETQKRAAAARAVEFVRPGMRLGLGTGSTARHFVDLLGERVRGGLDVVCVPTSRETEAQAQGCGIPLTTLNETPALDLTVDGADEIGPDLSLIKGGGGALLREKIVAARLRAHDCDRGPEQVRCRARPLSAADRGGAVRPGRHDEGAGKSDRRGAGGRAAHPAAGAGRPSFRHGWRPLDRRCGAGAD